MEWKLVKDEWPHWLTSFSHMLSPTCPLRFTVVFSFSQSSSIRLRSFFGHFSHRSEWQLIKIDYKSIYSRKCTEEDYQTWHLHNQVSEKVPCVSVIMFKLVPRTGTRTALVVPPGWALCNGTKADLHEAPAWKLLHAGEGLLQDPLGWVLHLPSSWFRMVSWW